MTKGFPTIHQGMKRTVLIWLFFISFIEKNQAQTTAFFENTWTGYNTGNYPTGRFPSVVKTADLDNDGDLDAVVGQQTQATGFVVFINQGNGVYAQPVVYASAL